MQLLDVSLRWLRVTRVDLCLLIYFVVYAVVWLNFHVNWLRTGSWEVEYLNGCLLATSGIAGLAYGLFRAWYFNPCMFLGYGDWLQTTPWTPRQPLPWGPLRLCWQDLLVLGIVAASLPWPLTIRLLAPLIPFSFRLLPAHMGSRRHAPVKPSSATHSQFCLASHHWRSGAYRYTDR